jgi:hypothetical protein
MLVLTSPYICCSCNCLESTALQHHGRCMKSQLQRFISEVKPSRTTRFFPIFPSVNQHGWLNNKSVSADLNSSTKFCDQVQTPSQTDTVVNMARNGTNRSPHIYIFSSNLFFISNLSIHMENIRTLIPNLRTTWQHQSYMHVAVIKFNPSHA